MKSSYLFVVFASIGILFILSCTIVNVSADEQTLICRGETLRVSARLLMNGTYGDPVPGQVVEFFDETNDFFIASALTNPNGDASIDWQIPLYYELGLTIVNATFRGNDTHALTPSYQQIPMIIQASTNIDVRIEEVSFVPGDQMLCEVLLTDDNGIPLSNESVTVYCTSTLLASSKTNYAGQVNFIINCNQSWGDLGSNNITVVYHGNSQRFYAPSADSFSISINKIETSLEMYNEIPPHFELNDSLSFDLFLESNISVLANAVVEVILDDKKLTDVITNESGIVNFPIIIDAEFSLGPHILRFEYAGTERFASSTLIIDLVVISPAITKVDLLTQCVIGEESIVRLYLSDILDRPIHNASIKLIDSMINQSVVQKLQTDTNYSDFRLQIQEPKGTRNYDVVVIGNDFIVNETSSFVLTIWTQPLISIINSSIESYASPVQVINFGLRLSDHSSNYSNSQILVFSNDYYINVSYLTDNFGVVIISMNAPLEEGKCDISIIYKGNDSEYELSAIFLYSFYVTQAMPIKVEFQQYNVIPSLQQIQLKLRIVAYNGTSLRDVELRYSWLNITGSILSAWDGLMDLRLLVPSKDGQYGFVYITTPSSSVLSCNGSLILSINEQESAASQGVGIGSISISIVLSLGIVSIPGIIRKRMIGL